MSRANKHYSAVIVVALFVAALVPTLCYAETTSTTGNCSPAFVSSTVDGSITISCASNNGDFQTLKQALQSLQTQNQLSSEEMRGYLETTNLMLGRLYKRTGNASASMSDTLRALHRIQVLVTEQSAILRDTTNASSGVSSTNQTGGITAGSIDTVVTDCQTDRTRFLKPLQQFYAQGFDIRQRLYQSNITDSQIDAIVSDSDIWYNQVIAWLTSSMGKPAADRFQDTSGSAIRYNISPGGTHQPGEIDKASNYLTSLNRLLANLETLMTSNHFDPLGN